MRKLQEILQTTKTLFHTSVELRRQADAMLEKARDLRLQVQHRRRTLRATNGGNSRKAPSQGSVSPTFEPGPHLQP